jgi:hypothetical protein
MTSVSVKQGSDGHFKDAILARLAQTKNVAQFISFAPKTASLRFACVNDAPREMPATVPDAVALLLARSGEGSINVRSFDPYQPKSHEFIYGLTEHAAATREIERLSAAGLYTIANETIDVSDGGVSGVLYGGVIEFAPDDTPRCVERPGTASLPRELGAKLLRLVYGFDPALDEPPDVRVEFSIHPLRRGARDEHTLIWEEEHTPPTTLEPLFVWPNRFSRLLGDKTFGLLLAETLGMRVPRTVVTNRRIAPFSFGTETGTAETWLRTAPTEPEPGRFTTVRGWQDPFSLMSLEDPTGATIPSVLAQEGVRAEFSGAAATRGRGSSVLVEGVRGSGDRFMLGEAPPEPLPASVTAGIRSQLRRAIAILGDVRIEWVHDGTESWIVQLHRGEIPSIGNVLYPGDAETWHEFDVSNGLEELRILANTAAKTGAGIVVVGQIGVTSHFGDVVRRARVPSRIEARSTFAEQPHHP